MMRLENDKRTTVGINNSGHGENFSCVLKLFFVRGKKEKTKCNNGKEELNLLAAVTVSFKFQITVALICHRYNDDNDFFVVPLFAFLFFMGSVGQKMKKTKIL